MFKIMLATVIEKVTLFEKHIQIHFHNFQQPYEVIYTVIPILQHWNYSKLLIFALCHTISYSKSQNREVSYHLTVQ